MPKIVILDANNLIFRSFFGMRPLSTSTGIPVNAVYGALKTIKSIVQLLKPDFLVATWDSGKKTFRSELDPNYKAQRPATPSDLKMQFSLLKEAFDCLGIPHITAPVGAEGDDITGTIAVKAANAGMEAVIISADKDFYQLCQDPLIRVYSYTVAKKNPDEALVDADYIKRTYFVDPHQLVHVKALMGEKCDNIMGIPGIGPKTATMLIQKHGNLHSLLNHLSKNPHDKYYHIYQQKHVAELALELAIIKTNIEVEEISIKPVDKIIINEEQLKDFFNKLEMNSFLRENFPHWKNLFNYQTAISRL